MNNFVLIVLTAVVFCFSNSVYSAEIPLQIKNSLKERMAFGLLKGVVVGVIDKEGVEYISYGGTSVNSNRAIDENTLFEIGSITKTFTATLLADAQERGEINQDDSVATYLSSVSNPNLADISLVSLANHHSGLSVLPSNFSPENPADPYTDYSRKNLYDYMQGIKKSELNIGSYLYSNTGAGLLGHVLTVASAKGYSNLLKERVTSNLDMSRTYVGVPSNQSNLAVGYNGNRVPHWTFDVLEGAGGIFSTAQDMLSYLQAQTTYKDKYLTQAFRKTRTVTKTDIYKNTNIGLGWFIVKQQTGADIIYHDGNTNGYWSFAGFLADGSKAVVVLSNSGNENINDIGFHILNTTNPILKTPKRTEIGLKPLLLEKYQGRYHNELGLDFNVSLKGNKLYVGLNGQSPLAIYPASKTEFFYRDLRAEIVFNSNTQAPSLTLIQDGERYIAKLIE
jgi:CubicO group peptidase (beta-lactamase class C family)